MDLHGFACEVRAWLLPQLIPDICQHNAPLVGAFLFTGSKQCLVFSVETMTRFL